MKPTKLFNLWAVISPAEGVPGEWLAHCLTIDVMSQGSSPEEALEMIVEACGMVIADDLNRGADSHLRNTASPEEWEALFEIQRSADIRRSVESHAAEALTQFPPQYTGRSAINFNLRFVMEPLPLGTLPPGAIGINETGFQSDVPLHLLGKKNESAHC